MEYTHRQEGCGIKSILKLIRISATMKESEAALVLYQFAVSTKGVAWFEALDQKNRQCLIDLLVADDLEGAGTLLMILVNEDE